jgi:hypothetical protein
MKRKALADLLARYIDGLIGTEDAGSAPVKAWEQPDLQLLLPLVDRLRSKLVPVEPSARFEAELKTKLIAAWNEQRLNEIAEQEQRREFYVRAAVVGSFLSLAAVAAYVVRERMRPAQSRAA